MPTLRDIANSQNVEYRTVQRWYAKATTKYGDFGTLENGTRYFTPDEVEQVLEFASKRVRLAVEPEIVQKHGEYVEAFDTEVVEPSGIIPIENGFHAGSSITFSGKNYSELASHLQTEVLSSGQSTANTLNNLFSGLTDADQQLGLAIGAKRLQNVLGTADAVFTQGLSQWAQTQGLGKSVEGV